MSNLITIIYLHGKGFFLVEKTRINILTHKQEEFRLVKKLVRKEFYI